MDAPTAILGLLSGALVGFILGVLGGGGSILALPLLLYVVGHEGDPHAAIGTTALAVAASALANLVHHHRAGHVRLGLGLWFALPGVAGALLGARVGLHTDGGRLVVLFAILMLVVAWRTWRHREPTNTPTASPERTFRRRLVVPLGFGVGALSGFFGIGGGFLIVPALLYAGGVHTKEAVATSLVAVALFGLATATPYGLAGKLDLPIAAVFIVGGVLAGALGVRVANRLPRERLRRLFAGTLAFVALYMLARTLA